MSPADFERTYEKHFESVFRYVVCSVARRDIAEDITSDAFLRLLRRGERIDSSLLPAWLIAVARNLIVDYWRSVAREERLDSVPEPRTQQSEIDLARWLASSPDLKPGHRACLTLRYVHGMDRVEIARHTGLTDNQVKSYLQYGLQLLRKILAEK
jgi:RNA polymerase sigma-70 factor, ECF subfamily